MRAAIRTYMLNRWKLPYIFVLLLLISILLSHSTSFLCYIIDRNDLCNVQYFPENSSLRSIFISSVIVGPFLETLFYQFAIIEIGFKYFGKNQNIVPMTMFGSSFVFGIVHSYNVK